MSLTGPADGPMVKVGVPIADISAGLYGVIGILAGLLERTKSGSGQRVSTSLLAGQIGLHTFQGTRYLVAGDTPPTSGNHHPAVSPSGVFMASDGAIVIAAGNDAIWGRLAILLNIDPNSERFVSNAKRIENHSELEKLLNSKLATDSVSEWLIRFEKVGVPAGEVKKLDAVYASEQVRQQNLIWTAEHSALGPIKLPGSPIRYSRSEVSLRLPPPTLGEHSDEIRNQFRKDS